MKFLVLLAQVHQEFRIPELQALAELENIQVEFSSCRSNSPYLEIELESEEEAIRLVRRSFLAISVHEIYAQGASLDELHAQNRKNSFEHFGSASFRFDFRSFQRSRSLDQQLEIINSFAYMGLPGPVRLKNPGVVFTVVEHFEPYADLPKYQYFGRFIAYSDRHQIDVYNLKKRPRIGTTSFDAEMAFVTCNFAKVKPFDFVYDPFSGTGSFPLAAAYLGAYVVGSDIDVRAIKGYDINFNFYSTQSRFLGVAAMDFTHYALRQDLMFDAIVCDPPYGVREIIKVCGSKKPIKPTVIIDNEPAHLRRDYIQPKVAYSFDKLVMDLLDFAAEKLRVGGRLAFWMPLAGDDPLAAPQHKQLLFISSVAQDFNKWKRWLLTYEKRPEGQQGEDRAIELKNSFRSHYFTRVGP